MHAESMRVRLTSLHAMLLALLLTAGCSGLIFYLHYAADQNARQMLQYAAQKIQREAIDQNGKIIPEELAEEEYGLAGDNIALLALNSKNQIVSRSQSAVPFWPPHANSHWRLYIFHTTNNTFVVGLYWHKTEHDLKIQSIILILLCFSIFCISTLGAWLLIGRTLSPIGKLARQAETASMEDLQMRLQPPSNDREVLELVHTLNAMLERLAKTASVRQRFYAAASHELRTPLQALSGHLELALMRQRSSGEYREALQEARLQTQRLTTLVLELLSLNRLETSKLPLFEPVDVPQMFAAMLPTMKNDIHTAGVQIEERWETSIVYAPPLYLEILLRNLLENAVRYSPPFGKIKVHMSLKANSPCITLSNQSAHIPAEDMTRLCEPFYRPDQSRNGSTGGNGLGLAICNTIASACSWNMLLEMQEEEFKVEIKFHTVTPLQIEPVAAG